MLGAVPVVSLPKTSVLKQVGKHTDGTLLMGIEDTTLGPSSLQAGQRPTKNLASDPATPQSCGLRPVTEKSEIETEIKVNLSDKTHKVMLSEEKLQ